MYPSHSVFVCWTLTSRIGYDTKHREQIRERKKKSETELNQFELSEE
jgi:hypothetical protein